VDALVGSKNDEHRDKPRDRVCSCNLYPYPAAAVFVSHPSHSSMLIMMDNNKGRTSREVDAGGFQLQVGLTVD
jgi:hypothetical protein